MLGSISFTSREDRHRCTGWPARCWNHLDGVAETAPGRRLRLGSRWCRVSLQRTGAVPHALLRLPRFPSFSAPVNVSRAWSALSTHRRLVSLVLGSALPPGPTGRSHSCLCAVIWVMQLPDGHGRKGPVCFWSRACTGECKFSHSFSAAAILGALLRQKGCMEVDGSPETVGVERSCIYLWLVRLLLVTHHATEVLSN